MTTAGKVLAVLNVLLAIAFLLVTAPVVRYRIDTLQQIETEQKKVPERREQIISAERELSNLRSELRRLQGLRSNEVTVGLNEKDTLDTRIAIINDTLNDARSKVSVLSSSLKEIQGEIAARETQIQDLERELGQGSNEGKQLTQNIASLKETLASTRQQLQKVRDEALANNQRLAELSERLARNSAANRLAHANQ